MTAAEELRRLDADSSITVIEQESEPCYSRVLLPHYVKGVVPREKVFVRAAAWYGEHNIEWQAGVWAAKVDTTNKFVATSEGREIPYDALLIASGGECKTIAEDPRGVSYLRTLADADQLRVLLNAAKGADSSAVVYGGGFIALEYINIFAKYEMPTRVLLRGEGFWTRLLSPEASEVLCRHAALHGVEIIRNVGDITALEKRGVLTGVRTEQGDEYAATILGVGIGTQGDFSLLEGTDIDRDEYAILANEYLETSAAHVYTAGDVARFVHPLFGRQLQFGNWLNAQMHGRTVAKTMAGERTAFTLLTSYATQLLGLHVVFIGDTSRAHAEETRLVRSEDAAHSELFLRDGRIVGAILVGDMSTRAAVTKAITERATTI